MTPEKENQTAHGILALLTVLNLLVLILRLWPLLIPLMLGLLAYGLWAMIHKVQQPETPTHSTPDAQQPRQTPVSEQELITLAFGLLQHRITEQIVAVYPHAKWVWGQPGARERFAAGETLTILLNDAGGYQKATVQVSDLQFYGLFYLPQGSVPTPDPETPPPPTEEIEPEEVDYGLLAFEWVEANMQRLSELNAEAITEGKNSFKIPAEELPHGDSWVSVCRELVRNGFTGAEPVANGIQIQTKPQEGE